MVLERDPGAVGVLGLHPGQGQGRDVVTVRAKEVGDFVPRPCPEPEPGDEDDRCACHRVDSPCGTRRARMVAESAASGPTKDPERTKGGPSAGLTLRLHLEMDL